MKSKGWIFGLIVLTFLFSLSNCKKENQLPSCTITYPNNGDEFEPGETIDISVEANDNDGLIAEVRFYVDDIGVSSSTSFPYTYTWNTSGKTTGSHIIKVTVKDNDGGAQTDECTILIIGNATVVTTEADSITHNSAISGGNITDDGGTSILERGVCWNTSQNPTLSNDHTTDGNGSGSFTSLMSGLSPNTIYYVRGYATNSVGTAYGNEINFTTSVTLPTVTTSLVSDITYNSAKSGGNVTDDGGVTVNERGICWSTSYNPTTADSITTDGSGTGNFTSSLTGLFYETTYYVRSYATSSIGTAYGDEVSFTTNPTVSPTVTTSSVSDITENSATVGGNVTADGGTTVTDRGIYYSISTSPETTGTKLQIGSGTGTFSTSLTSLSSGTTYNIIAYAINSQGEALGNEVSFTTNGTLTDSRDNHEYQWVKIGDQVWMAENLAYLPEVSPSSSESNTDPYYYIYDYQGSSVSEAKATSNYTTYGVLYNWPAAMAGESSSSSNPSGVQGVCPDGWHLPSDEELKELEMCLGMSQSEADDTGYRGTYEGGKLKETGTAHWNSPNDYATNESGFTAFPGGCRFNDGQFSDIRECGGWWSSTESSSTDAWYRLLKVLSSRVYRNDGYKGDGFSVRCIKDE